MIISEEPTEKLTAMLEAIAIKKGLPPLVPEADGFVSLSTLRDVLENIAPDLDAETRAGAISLIAQAERLAAKSGETEVLLEEWDVSGEEELATTLQELVRQLFKETHLFPNLQVASDLAWELDASLPKVGIPSKVKLAKGEKGLTPNQITKFEYTAQHLAWLVAEHKKAQLLLGELSKSGSEAVKKLAEFSNVNVIELKALLEAELDNLSKGINLTTGSLAGILQGKELNLVEFTQEKTSIAGESGMAVLQAAVMQSLSAEAAAEMQAIMQIANAEASAKNIRTTVVMSTLIFITLACMMGEAVPPAVEPVVEVPDEDEASVDQAPTIELTSVPGLEQESIFRGELVSLERGNEAAGDLERRFTQEFGRRGEGLIFRNSEITEDGVGPDVQLIFTPVVSNEDGSQHTGTEIYQLVGETWHELGVVAPESSDLEGESLISWQNYLRESDVITSGELDLNDLKNVRLTRVAAIDGGHILAEQVFIFETADGPKAIREFFVRDEDGKFHPVELANSDFDYEIAAIDIMTDGGPAFLLRNNNSENGAKVVVVPTELFNSIKDRNPVVSADGRQILNGNNTGEVLLENVGGVWAVVEAEAPVEAEISYTPEQQALLDANLFYGLEFTQMGGQEVAYSPLDAVDSPHYVYENGAWVDKHPGRNQLEIKVFPPVLEDGTSVWDNLERDGAVWDQEMMAYHYVGSPDADPGHEQYYQPLMAAIDSDSRDIEQGRVNHAETIQSADYVPGVSGVRIDMSISADHDYVKWWENLPKELSSQIYAEMYLEKFPSLRGKHVQVRIIAEDRTKRSSQTRPETFAQGNYVDSLDGWSTGIIEGANNVKIATLTISTKNIEGHEINFASASHYAFVWSLIVEGEGQVLPGDMRYKEFTDETIFETMSQSGRSAAESAAVKLSN